MDELAQRIISNTDNERVLKFLEIEVSAKTLNIIKWVGERNGPDEGGTTLFDNYGTEVPEDCKYSFDGKNIMVIPASGEIFAFHTGRFSIFFQCDFERSELENVDDFRKGYTFDCISDITELGDRWSFMKADFEGGEQEQFRWAYEKVLARSEEQ